MKTVVQSGEARLTELQIEGQQIAKEVRDTWVKLKPKYGLDLDGVNYDLSEDGRSLVPTMMKL